MKPHPVSDRVARWILRGFKRAEADDILRDLRELAADLGGARGNAYFWAELLKYPACRVWDRVRYRGADNHGRDDGRGGMDSILKDMRYAVRALARNPGFSLMTIAIMTLSMGAGTAIYSVVRGVLLDPLPVEEPDRLVSVWLAPVEGEGRSRMTPGNFTDVEGMDGVFSSVAAFSGETRSLTRGEGPVFLRGGAVTPAYFTTLGVSPIVGRAFREDEGDIGGPGVVMLSHHVWQQVFAADPMIVGSTILLDGLNTEVVGVAAPGVYPTQATVSAQIPFTASNQDFFIPLRYGTAGWANRRSHLLGMIGRLAPETNAETAAAALATLGSRLQADGQNETFLMTSFSEEVVGDVRFALMTLLISVSLVLLIAIVNVGALFVLRAEDRKPELAVRVALGAPKGRLVRQLLLESLSIVGISAVGAILTAQGVLGLIQRLVPYQVPRLSEVRLDGSTMLVTFALGLTIATAFALAPAFISGVWTRSSARGARGHTQSRRQRRLQGSIVALQAGLGVIVLVGATLFTRSYDALRSVDTGFSSHDTWTMSVPTDLPGMERIVQRVRELPGVAEAAVAYDHPLSRSWGDAFLIEGRPLSDDEARPSGSLRPFGEGYFSTVGIEVVEGRVPDDADMAGSARYAVINETLRDKWFASGTAVGSTIILPTAQRMGLGDGAFEIVGIVRDVRFLGPDQPVSPALYVPLSHFPVSASILLVRPDRDNVNLLAGVRRAVREVDSTLGVQRAQRLGDVLDDLLARPRFNMILLVSFGIFGLTLCGLGCYGLVGRVVAMRFREIGIRMALGAERPGIARSVMGSALNPLAIGTMVGLVVAMGLGGVIRSSLFDVSPTDPLSLVASAAFVLVVGAAAALVPTLRGLSIDPASTLRNE
jgi:putative ABC transport system permease protein